MFTTNCFIRKNTSELRTKLKELGYHICPCAEFKDSVWLRTSFITNKPVIHGIGYFNEDLTGRKNKQEELDFFLSENYKSENPRIDCGDNEELFIALAALRDDTDKNQWFIVDDLWIKSSNDIPDKYVQMHGDKATVEEIIEYFT
jgi:hypothetical protein